MTNKTIIESVLVVNIMVKKEKELEIGVIAMVVIIMLLAAFIALYFF
jgi:hypothetical protein